MLNSVKEGIGESRVLRYIVDEDIGTE